MKKPTAPTARELAWSAIWTDAKYLRLQARKDAALRAESQAFGRPDGAAATTRRKRVMRTVETFEAAYFVARGLVA